jgi:hypothetical protein
MNERAEMPSVSLVAKIGFGILIPVVFFVGYQLALIGSTSGTGSWDGMSLFFGSLVIVPGLLVVNCWVLPLRWKRKFTLFFAGMMLPAAIGLVEYLWLQGPTKARAAINGAFVAPCIWIWLFGVAFFVPLIVSVTHAVIRRGKSVGPKPDRDSVREGSQHHG